MKKLIIIIMLSLFACDGNVHSVSNMKCFNKCFDVISTNLFRDIFPDDALQKNVIEFCESLDQYQCVANTSGITFYVHPSYFDTKEKK